MREIKFRGKRDDNGNWVYGYPIIVSYKAWIKDINDTTTNPRILAQDFADFRCVEVEKETVGQYTGLKDRNGVEIYEGDVVSTPYYIMNKEVDREQHAVIFQNGCFGIERENRFICLADLRQATKFDYVSNVGDIAVAWDSPFEVIGNIHDQEGKA